MSSTSKILDASMLQRFSFKNPGRFNASTLQLQKSWMLHCFNASASKMKTASMLQFTLAMYDC
jgi:hypothetical protein